MSQKDSLELDRIIIRIVEFSLVDLTHLWCLHVKYTSIQTVGFCVSATHREKKKKRKKKIVKVMKESAVRVCEIYVKKNRKSVGKSITTGWCADHSAMLPMKRTNAPVCISIHVYLYIYKYIYMVLVWGRCFLLPIFRSIIYLTFFFPLARALPTH